LWGEVTPPKSIWVLLWLRCSLPLPLKLNATVAFISPCSHLELPLACLTPGIRPAEIASRLIPFALSLVIVASNKANGVKASFFPCSLLFPHLFIQPWRGRQDLHVHPNHRNYSTAERSRLEQQMKVTLSWIFS
jgi:hypothetical protein